MSVVLLDTGVIVALLDRSESRHAECVRVVEDLDAPLVTCEAVIAESCYLTRDLPGAADAILENVQTGLFQLPMQLSRDAAAIQKIIRKYRIREVDLADACLIHLATELRSGAILTLDGDFLVYRWSGTRRFEPLLPWR